MRPAVSRKNPRSFCSGLTGGAGLPPQVLPSATAKGTGRCGSVPARQAKTPASARRVRKTLQPRGLPRLWLPATVRPAVSRKNPRSFRSGLTGGAGLPHVRHGGTPWPEQLPDCLRRRPAAPGRGQPPAPGESLAPAVTACRSPAAARSAPRPRAVSLHPARAAPADRPRKHHGLPDGAQAAVCWLSIQAMASRRSSVPS